MRAINDEDDYKKCRNYWKYLKGKMAKDGISVSAMMQKDADPDGRATLIFITHSASEKAVQRMLKALNPEICRVENVIRVEG